MHLLADIPGDGKRMGGTQMTCWGCNSISLTDLCETCAQILDYREIVDKKYVEGLTPEETRQMDVLASKLDESTAGFYEPIIAMLKTGETPIKNLKPGARFRLELKGWGNNYGDKTGVVVSHCGNGSRTVVKWDGEKQEHSFIDKKTGNAVQFFTPGTKISSVCSETPVYRVEK